MKFSVVHYSGDRFGGAARAALRLHAAFKKHQRFDSKMIVAEKINDDYTITELNKGYSGQFTYLIKSAMDGLPRRFSKQYDDTPRSAGWATRLKASEVNSQSSDIAHLHWINGAFLSIEEIGRITKPLVWSFHDMWPFCGAEHLSNDAQDARWRLGYTRSSHIKGFDFDRWVWQRKKANLKQPIQIVTPSQWLADCVRQSSLMRHLSVHVIPNTLDTNVYKPMNKVEARKLLNLPQNRKLILFGAIKGTQLPYKGWDLLMPALEEISHNLSEVDAIIFGQSRPAKPPELKLVVHWMGHLHDDFSLAALYSAADLLIIPSRQESFGQTGSEAHACGCPVIAFSATGLKDVVRNQETGLLVKPYDSTELAAAITYLLTNDDIRKQFGMAARQRALSLWSDTVVATQYEDVYEEALASFGSSSFPYI